MYLIKDLFMMLLDEKLVSVVAFINHHFGINVFTSLWRFDNSTHKPIIINGKLQPLRFVDMRCRDEGIAIRIAQVVNDKWQYDFKRPDKSVVVIYDEDGNFKGHLHLQVHPNTRERK